MAATLAKLGAWLYRENTNGDNKLKRVFVRKHNGNLVPVAKNPDDYPVDWDYSLHNGTIIAIQEDNGKLYRNPVGVDIDTNDDDVRAKLKFSDVTKRAKHTENLNQIATLSGLEEEESMWLKVGLAATIMLVLASFMINLYLLTPLL